MSLYLTKEEEGILDGEYGERKRKALEILVTVGTIYGAEKLIPVKSAQLSGVSYKTMGKEGTEFIKDFSDERVSVPTYLNPCGMDTERWKEMGIDETFAQNQKGLLEAYRSMGVTMSLTCTPYYIRKPKSGEHLAWAESSAVVYANAICGARTNREGGPSALASAIIGKTPCYGLHVAKNRRAEVIIEIKEKIEKEEYGLLGVHVGRIVGAKIPYFVGLHYRGDCLKQLGAAMAASGAVAMFHVEKTTPKWRKSLSGKREKIIVEKNDLEETKDSITTEEVPQLYAFGCPHLSLREIGEIAGMLEKGRVREKIWLCTSRYIKRKADRLGYTKIIERHGMLLCDTCMVVSPIENLFSITATNSGKAAVYLPSFCKQKVVFDSAKKLLKFEGIRRGLV